MLLARLIRPWRESLPAHVRALFGVDDVSVPATTSDAIWLARDLAGLMDQVETDNAKWSELASIAPDDLADWWQVTLGFLDIVTKLWPEILEERKLSNPAAHRNELIWGEVRRLRDHPPQGPVIAAGSTGSIPATAELVSVIARLPQGAVVLPGLDRDLDEGAWNLLGLRMIIHPPSATRNMVSTSCCRLLGYYAKMSNISKICRLTNVCWSVWSAKRCARQKPRMHGACSTAMRICSPQIAAIGSKDRSD